MKQTNINNNQASAAVQASSGPAPSATLTSVHPKHKLRRQVEADADEVLTKVDETKQAFQMSMRFFAYQVVFSSFSNIVGTVIGHPLDTIRVRMQIEQGPSFMRTCQETLRGEGMRGFFKGMISPIVGVTPYNTMVFTTTEAVKQELGSRSPAMSEEQKSLIAGSTAGGFALIIYNPVELLKVRAQVNRVENVQYRKEVPKLIRNEGFSGLYKGFGALFLRDVPGWGAYFLAYEWLKRIFGLQEAKAKGEDNTWLNIAIKVWAGGVAGQISWIVGYPQDIIKTQIQCTETHRVPAREVMRNIYAREGIQGFFKGLSPTLARSFVVNGVTLPTFEYLNDRITYSGRKSD